MALSGACLSGAANPSTIQDQHLNQGNRDRTLTTASALSESLRMTKKCSSASSRAATGWSAEWAGAKMGLTAAETDAYAKAVVQADFEEAGDGTLSAKLLGDLTSAGIEIDEPTVRAALQSRK